MNNPFKFMAICLVHFQRAFLPRTAKEMLLAFMNMVLAVFGTAFLFPATNEALRRQTQIDSLTDHLNIYVVRRSCHFLYPVDIAPRNCTFARYPNQSMPCGPLLFKVSSVGTVSKTPIKEFVYNSVVQNIEGAFFCDRPGKTTSGIGIRGTLSRTLFMTSTTAPCGLK